MARKRGKRAKKENSDADEQQTDGGAPEQSVEQQTHGGPFDPLNENMHQSVPPIQERDPGLHVRAPAPISKGPGRMEPPGNIPNSTPAGFRPSPGMQNLPERGPRMSLLGTPRMVGKHGILGKPNHEQMRGIPPRGPWPGAMNRPPRLPENNRPFDPFIGRGRPRDDRGRRWSDDRDKGRWRNDDRDRRNNDRDRWVDDRNRHLDRDSRPDGERDPLRGPERWHDENRDQRHGRENPHMQAKAPGLVPSLFEISPFPGENRGHDQRVLSREPSEIDMNVDRPPRPEPRGRGWGRGRDRMREQEVPRPGPPPPGVEEINGSDPPMAGVRGRALLNDPGFNMASGPGKPMINGPSHGGNVRKAPLLATPGRELRKGPGPDIPNVSAVDINVGVSGGEFPGIGPKKGLVHEEEELRREEMLMARLEARIKEKEMAQLGRLPGGQQDAVSGLPPGPFPVGPRDSFPVFPPGAVPTGPPGTTPILPPASVPGVVVQEPCIDGIPMSAAGNIASGPPPTVGVPPVSVGVPPVSAAAVDGQAISGFTPDGIPVFNVNDPLCDPSERQAILNEMQKKRTVDPAIPMEPGVTPQPEHDIPRPPAVISLFSKEEEQELIAARRKREAKEEKKKPKAQPSSEGREKKRDWRDRKKKEPIWKIPEAFEFVDVEVEKKQSEELFEKHIALDPSEKEQLEKPPEENSENQDKIPAFLLCPLCKDLLEDPVVLPCFHTMCRSRCVPRLTKDDMNLWCPQCGELKLIKGLVENLKAAVTFEKMIAQHKEEREKEKEKEKEETSADGAESEEPPVSSEPPEKDKETMPNAATELTCKECQKIYSLPLRLTCGHSICKFPCAYRSFKFNSKVLCGECEKPSWVKGVSELPVAKDLVAKIQKIKGEFYLTEHAQELRTIDNKETAEQYIGITALFDDDETFKKRLQKLDNVNRQHDGIPSLISMPLGAPVTVAEPKNSKKKTKTKAKGKKKQEDDDDFNPDELFPSEDGPEMYDPFNPGDGGSAEVGYGPGYVPQQGVDGIPQAFVADPYMDPYGVPPVDGIPYGGDGSVATQPLQAAFQPPVLDVKSMVPENPGSNFDYIQPWNLFAQQTQNYYATYYASLGGIPPEAEQQVKDYLEKCWSWYSAYFKLQAAKQEAKTEKKSVPTIEPATEDDATELATKVKKLKTAKNKREKEKLITEFSFEVAAAVTKDEKKEELEIEELKILLLKKQLELKLKNAKSKSEARDLKKLKELVEEEEGREEELDEEAQKKKEKEEKEAKEKELERIREAARQKQLERERQIEQLEKQRKRSRTEELRKLEKARKKEQEKREREEKEKERRREEKRKREESRMREGYDNQGAPNSRTGFPAEKGRERTGFQKRNDYDPHPPFKKKRKFSRSRSRSGSRRSRSGSRSSSGSRGRTPEKSRDAELLEDRRRKPVLPFKTPEIDQESPQEPKFVKVTNLPDDVTAKSLKSFVEAFGKVINCKIGKMQGEMMAVCQMQNMADAISCVREMHGLPFKGKLLEVRYMGNKPNIKQVEVSLPDVYDRPKDAPKAKPMSAFAQSTAPSESVSNKSVFGGDQTQRLEQRKLLISNLPWGTTEREVIDFVSHHAFVLHCRVATNPDRFNRGLYAEVVLESYFDVLKCINALHGIRYEGRQLEVKKVTI